jgi:hypothetical protein
MNVSNVGSCASASHSSRQSQFKAVKDDFQKLKSALDSGDVSSAQDAFATLKQDMPAPKNRANNSQFGNDLQSVGTALASGDLSGAQKAFASFQQDVQTSRASHAHKHHNHHDVDQGSETNSGGDGAPTTLTTSPTNDAIFSELA